MQKVVVSEILKSDILSGDSRYLRDGYLTFNKVTLSLNKTKPTLMFFNNEVHLATTEISSSITLGDLVSLILTDGWMRIELI